MSGIYDTPCKLLITYYPEDWLNKFGFRFTGRIEIVETEIAFVSPEADRLLLLRGAPDELAHIDPQATRDVGLDNRMLKYNIFLRDMHKANVASTALLLRPEADSPAIAGRVSFSTSCCPTSLDFVYNVVRLWEIPVEEFLEGPLGTVPLAFLAKGAKERLNEVAEAVGRRLDALPEDAASELRACTYLLMGLRYTPEVAQAVLGGLSRMKESATFQSIIAEGREEGLHVGEVMLRKVVLRHGTARFGAPDDATRARLEAESGVERLEELDERLDRVASWDELLS